MDAEPNKQPERLPENKMGYMPVRKLLITMSVPMMFSMLVQALYNVVDSIFVSHISENALTAVSLAFPMQNLLIAVGVGTGVGVNALLSRSLGEKNFALANKTANQALFLSLMSGLVFVAIGLFVSRQFLMWQTDVQEIIDYGTQYLTVCCVFSFGVFFQITSERLLQSTGKTFDSMLVQIIGAIINIILDPILIFGLFFFPRLEVLGAAIATVSGQIIGMIAGILINIKRNKEITLSIRGMKPSLQVIKRIYSVGFPSMIMASIGSIMTFGLNRILLTFTTTATAVFGAYFKLQSFIFMPVFGLNNGMVPIAAYNYGAKKGNRIKETIKYSVIYATIIMSVGILIFQIFPGLLLGLFKPTADMLKIGVPCLRIISTHFIFAGFCIVSMSLLQSMGRGFTSLLISVSRQLVVLLPSAFLLSKLGNVNLVWWAFPIAEIASLALCAIFLKKLFREKIKPLMN